MHKIHPWLSKLLVLQLLAAAGLFWYGSEQRQQKPAQVLLNFDAKQLDRIVINNPENTLNLIRSDDVWRLPELQQLPADAGKLNDLLDKLRQLKGGWPVATTTGSHERFEVAANKFQRRIQLYRGKQQVGELFVGTSPGFRKSHIRRADDDAVYSAKLNSFDLPLDQNVWLDKSLLAVKDVSGIKGPDYVLEKDKGAWRFSAADNVDESQADQDKAKQLASALASLRIQAVITDPPEAALSEDNAIVLLVAAGEQHWRYRFVQVKDQYLVNRDDSEKVFSLAQFDFDRITKIDKAQLTSTENQEDE